MRIGIAGASGTGKTTLAKAIAAQYGWPINPVGSRSVAKSMGFDNPYDVDAAGRRKEFQESLFAQKSAWEEEQEAFVTDRTYLDNLTYCALHMPAELEDGAIDRYKSQMKRYDLVLFLPRVVNQKLSDGVRLQNETYHEFYELILRKLLKSTHGLRLRTLAEPLADRRAVAIEDINWILRTRARQAAER